jgi:glycosyltransferase involved in cell wall biosynthesis
MVRGCMPPPRLSVVVPAYNEAARIGGTLRAIRLYLDGRGESDAEVLVVDDGSRDGTAAVVADADPRAVVLGGGANRGKGHAVKTGVLASRGARVLFSDADLSTPIEELAKLEAALAAGAAVAIGSRGLPASDIRVRQSLPREMMGRGFNVLVRALVLGGFMDTQCGFKLLEGETARGLFREVRLDGFAFDVELLWLARRRGVRVAEVPVTWRHADRSKVSPVVDAAKMFRDIVRIRWLHRDEPAPNGEP